ncbi:MAG: hypothetical protein HC809_07070 [Gammaproteobacteria bacterium]|nr:hypothetical protein [Gammaproteobacteria bacterium]
MNDQTLIWGVLFGSIGLGYAMYGRRQKRVVPFVAGLGLIGYTYFVDSTAAIVLIGLALLAAPFIVKV